MAARVSQQTVQVLVQPTGERARVSQLTVSALEQPTAVQARVSQLSVAIVYDASLPPVGPATGRSSVVVAG